MIKAGADVRNALEAAGDRVLLHDLSGYSRTGSQIVEDVDRLAGALLREANIGARIGLWYQNSMAAVEAFLAVEWIGGARVPVDPGAPLPEAASVFAAAGVDVVLADRGHANGLPQKILVHDNDAPLVGPPAWPAVDVDPGQPLLVYPRAVHDQSLFAVPLSYANWRATMSTSISLYQSGSYGPWLEADECFLSAQQIMHGTGFVGTFPFLEMGRPQVLSPAFDAAQILEAIKRFRVTSTVLVGPMLSRFTHAASREPKSAASLRHVIYGGGAVRPDEIRRSMQQLGPVLTQGYGRLEGGWPLTLLNIEDHRAIAEGDDYLAASCGRAIKSVNLKLRPVNGAAADCGELCVASGMTALEYTSPDGWCSLGDLVRIDERGYVFYQGRLDRMINTGYHIYPVEVEETIARVAGVEAVRVIGEPNGGLQRMVAYLVLNSGTSEDGAIDRVRHELGVRLAKYKIPSQFHIVNQLPQA